MEGLEPVEVEAESAWTLVEAAIPAAEIESVRRVIGEKLIDEVETAHREVVALLEIWQEYRKRIDCDDAGTATTVAVQQVLPEPPAARDNLLSEIQFFANSIKKRSGMNPAVAAASPAVLQYALGEGSRPSSSPTPRRDSAPVRPQTASSNGNTTPLRPTTAKSVDSGSRMINRAIDAADGGLGAFTMDVNAHRLCVALRHERDSLLADGEFLQECLDGEHEHRTQMLAARSAATVPSLQDLRRVRSELEAEYFDKSTLKKATPPRRPCGSRVAVGAVLDSLPPVTASPSRDSLPAVTASPPKPPPQRQGSGGGTRRASKVRMALDADVSLRAPRPPPREPNGRRDQRGQPGSPLRVVPRPPPSRGASLGSPVARRSTGIRP